MGLEEQIAEAIVVAFDELGGDPQNAILAARGHETIDSWIQQETATIAIAGGAEMIIPGIHALTIPMGISFLIHKMAYMSWGLGAIKRAYVVETAHHSDLRNILTLWGGNASYYNMHILEYKALSLDVFMYALTDEGYAKLQTAIANAEQAKTDAVLLNTLKVLKTLVDEFSGDERAMNQIGIVTDEDTAEALIAVAQTRVAEHPVNPNPKKMNRRLGSKLALRLAGQISARLPAKFLVGFIPIAGAIANAFFNAQTLMSMAETARKYYANTFTRADLEEFAALTADDAAPTAEE
jgi:hypothetical protein